MSRLWSLSLLTVVATVLAFAVPAPASASGFRYVLYKQTVTHAKKQAVIQYINGIENKNLLCVKTVNAKAGARTSVTGWVYTDSHNWAIAGAVTDYAGDDSRTCYRIPNRHDSDLGSVTIIFTGTGGQQIKEDLRNTEHRFFY